MVIVLGNSFVPCLVPGDPWNKLQVQVVHGVAYCVRCTHSQIIYKMLDYKHKLMLQVPMILSIPCEEYCVMIKRVFYVFFIERIWFEKIVFTLNRKDSLQCLTLISYITLSCFVFAEPVPATIETALQPRLIKPNVFIQTNAFKISHKIKKKAIM